MYRSPRLSAILFLLIFAACTSSNPALPGEENAVVEVNRSYIRAVNRNEIKTGNQIIVIRGALLIDGLGGEPVENSGVLIKGNKIEWVGKANEINIPKEAQIVEARGQTLMPGLIDAHFHLDRNNERLALFLRKGITTIRDPGAWIEDYEEIRASGKAIPRLYLTGPHLDMFPPAYPDNSFLLQDREEARMAVQRFVEQGASAIKVYFRLSLGLIEEVCSTAHSYGIPVTAHLEITHAGDAIRAGLDGIEHITSFGPALLPLQEAEQYRQRVLADNQARRRGRYEVWDNLTLENNPRVDSILKIATERKTFICPTLGAFEKQLDQGDSLEVRGFQKMMAFTGLAYQAGARIVVGSHSWVPYAENGLAYAHEMALLNRCRMNPGAVISAATLENARFLQIEHQAGSIETGKLADLILLEGNPLTDMAAMENVRRVMLNGIWIEE